MDYNKLEPGIRYALPTGKGVIKPEGGWKESTYYVVEVAFRSNNPVHRAILFTGFLNGRKPGEPGAYSYLTSPGYDDSTEPYDAAFYLRAVRELCDDNLEPPK